MLRLIFGICVDDKKVIMSTTLIVVINRALVTIFENSTLWHT